MSRAEIASEARMMLWKTGQEGDYYAIEEDFGLLEIPKLPTHGRPPTGYGWPEDEGRVRLFAALRRNGEHEDQTVEKQQHVQDRSEVERERRETESLLRQAELFRYRVVEA